MFRPAASICRNPQLSSELRTKRTGALFEPYLWLLLVFLVLLGYKDIDEIIFKPVPVQEQFVLSDLS